MLLVYSFRLTPPMTARLPSIVSVVSVVAQMLIGFWLASALLRDNLINRVVRSVFFFPTIVALATIGLVWRFLLDPDPNPPLPSDLGAPPNSTLLEVYNDVPGLPEAIRACFAGETVKIVRQREGCHQRAVA